MKCVTITFLLMTGFIFGVDANAQIDLSKYVFEKKLILNGIEGASGLTYDKGSNSLFVVSNRPTEVFQLDLSVINGPSILTSIPAPEAIVLNDFTDTEGIAALGNDFFAIVEEDKKRVRIVEISPSTNTIDNKLQAVIKKTISAGKPTWLIAAIWGRYNEGLESIAYSGGCSFVTVREKGKLKFRNLNGTDCTADWSGGEYTRTATQMNLNASEVRLKDISGLHHDLVSGNQLILSHESKILIEYDPSSNKEVANRLSLKDLPVSPQEFDSVPQAEGVTMDTNRIYICSEIPEGYGDFDDKTSLLYVFKKP